MAPDAQVAPGAFFRLQLVLLVLQGKFALWESTAM